MKKIITILVTSCLILSCSESFLDTQNVTKKDSQSFPLTQSDAEQVLVAAYRNILPGDPGGSVIMMSELMSDDRLGSGGTDDRFFQAVARYMKVEENMFSDLWSASYTGIYRSNFLLSSLEQIEFDSDAERNRIEGEAMFLRAYYYFDLARMFGTVPLVLDPSPQNNPKASAAELFGQIMSDFKNAIALLPSTSYNSIPRSMLGHATKWAAQGMAARAFLFYTGYYNQSSVTLPEGGEVTKQEVTGWIDDCVANSGHDLLPDFRNLWPYSFSPEYVYTKENELNWIREEGDNVEAVFVVKHSAVTSGARNLLNLFFGLRYQTDNHPDGYKHTFPFGQGWGVGSVNGNTYAQWPDYDLRKKASILNVNDPSEEVAYTFGMSNQIEETGFLQKKYIPINVYKLDGSGDIQSYGQQLYNTTYDFASENFQDEYVIRFSDILLMGAELGSSQAQAYLDRVRARVGLTPVPVTLDNIKAERRWELAFEGLRYFDLLRWHDENVLTQNRTNMDVINIGIPGKLSIAFRSETGGFVQIPQTQIELSEGILEQNPGWEGAGSQY